MHYQSRIYIAGHQGLVGSALMRALSESGFITIITKTFDQLDLCDQKATEQFFAQERPEFVFLAAARVGGIKANSEYPAPFLYDNMMIAANVIHAAYKYGVKKLLFLGSSCIYPRLCAQPIKEEYLLTGPLEATNEWYAIAKIAGLKLCQAYNKQYGTQFISCMPTNLYGPGDNFNLETSHVIPALIAKIATAKETQSPTISLWGTGKALREFLFVDDLGQALIFLMKHYQENAWINVGTGKDCTIAEVAQLIAEIIGFKGQLVFDPSKPDGTPRKVLDVSRINNLGWHAQVDLRQGLEQTISWYYHSLLNKQHEATL